MAERLEGSNVARVELLEDVVQQRDELLVALATVRRTCERQFARIEVLEAALSEILGDGAPGQVRAPSHIRVIAREALTTESALKRTTPESPPPVPETQP